MTFLTRNRLIAFAVTFAVSASAVSPSFAQARHRVQPTAPMQQLPNGWHYGSDGVIYSSTGSAVPGYVLSTPNQCWNEDGYGRWETCD